MRIMKVARNSNEICEVCEKSIETPYVYIVEGLIGVFCCRSCAEEERRFRTMEHEHDFDFDQQR